MVDKPKYPQIPSTVWWGLRSLLNRTPSVTIDERLLGTQLDVQDVAARQYITELRSVGIVTDEGKATELAHKWRLDDTYAEAVKQLIKATYPEGLIHIAPPGDAERAKVVSWFKRAGLGEGAAGNKAATYLLLSSPTPNEAPRASAKGGQSGDNQIRPRAPRKPAHAAVRATGQDRIGGKPATLMPDGSQRTVDPFPLNVNVQIHISADAGTEQIESIFQAMRRYLYDAPDS